MSKLSKGKIHRGVVSITGVTDLKPGDKVVVVKLLNLVLEPEECLDLMKEYWGAKPWFKQRILSLSNWNKSKD